MQKFIVLLCIAGLVACNNSSPKESAKDEDEPVEVITQEEEQEAKTEPIAEEMEEAATGDSNIDPVLGYYVGDFEASKYRENRRPSYVNKINICIDKFTADSVYGHSVVAGNDRPFAGTYEFQDSYYQVVAKEPGDDRYDGTFYFNLYPEELRMEGKWEANNKGLAVYERVFKLPKRDFEYDPTLDLPEDVSWAELYNKDFAEEFTQEGEFLTEDVLKLNASERLLTKEEVENMYKGDLEIIRNAIYARHGYSFKNRKTRYIFDAYVDWYVPISTDIRAQLTSIEQQNIDLLKRYEQHADRYYDVFGR